jgi:hypothetical protein
MGPDPSDREPRHGTIGLAIEQQETCCAREDVYDAVLSTALGTTGLMRSDMALITASRLYDDFKIEQPFGDGVLAGQISRVCYLHQVQAPS